MRYLVVAIMPIGIPCLAFILQQPMRPPENNRSRMASTYNILQQRQERSSLFRLGSGSISEHYLPVSSSSCTENDDAHNDGFVVVANEKTASSGVTTTSRRKALMISSSTIIALAAGATTTEASTIPTDGSLSRQLPDDDGNAATTTDKAPPLLLESSSLYRVQTTATTGSSAARGRPSVEKITKEDLLKDLQSKRAVFLGEHHPESRDHRLQAALIRSLHHSIVSEGTKTTTTHLAVGLEAFQGRFQPFLDEYSAGAIDGEELRTKTEWDSRWYWSFDAYRPIFEACRELGVRLLALDIATEDRLLVETGGLDAVNPETLREYVPDREGFEAFGSTPAYQTFVSYTLKPPYDLQQRTATPEGNCNNNKNISFSNFLARQMLRDEAMASAAWRWLSENPNGILVGCIGINHATFGCGVPGRLEQKLSKAAMTAAAAAAPEPSNDDPNNRRQQQQQQRMVASVLINPEPLNTGTELEICRSEGQPPIIDDDDGFDENNKARRMFPNNTLNQVCIENSIELQNYALQVDYVSLETRRQTTAATTNEPATNPQAKMGETGVLGLSDYLVFSPKETKGNRY